MSHELTIRNNGTVEMAYAGATPWHTLGNKLESGASIEVWTTAAGMDWRIHRAKVRYPASAADANNIANWRTMDDRHVLLRSDTGDALGIVSDNYKVVQPKTVLEFFRDLTDAAGFTLETAGTLFGGKRMWALAAIGSEAVIADSRDKVRGYLLLSTSCDGTMATEGRYTATRVVCNNTLSMARQGKASVKVTHRTAFDAASVKRDLGIELAQESFADAMDQFRRLAATPIVPADMVKATATLFVPGFAAMDGQAQIDAIKGNKAVYRVGTLAVESRRQIGGNLSGVDGTAYGWLNAVTQYVDHEARARSQDNRLASAWFGKGDSVKSQAYEMAIQMADGSTSYASGGLLDSVLAATRTC